MIYDYRRVVAFVTPGTRRRGQFGRSDDKVPGRLNAVFAGLDFSGKKLDVPIATAKSRRQN
jgi:hypothetical protein